jgi:alkylation response protein AidB-like acyl-CoA dehydrogenase
MKLKADAVQGGYVLNGTKFWITNATYADTLVVYAKTDARRRIARHHRLPDREGRRGLFHRPEDRQDGHARLARPPSWCSTTASCPKSDHGPLHGGVGVLMSGLDYERVVLAGLQLGIMQACLDTVIPYLRERKQFGKPIGTFQLMQAKVADMYVALQSARAYTYAVAKAAMPGRPRASMRRARSCWPARTPSRWRARRAGAGRRGLHHRLAGRTLSARRQAARHRRGDQRDPPDADRARTDRGELMSAPVLPTSLNPDDPQAQARSRA